MESTAAVETLMDWTLDDSKHEFYYDPVSGTLFEGTPPTAPAPSAPEAPMPKQASSVKPADQKQETSFEENRHQQSEKAKGMSGWPHRINHERWHNIFDEGPTKAEMHEATLHVSARLRETATRANVTTAADAKLAYPCTVCRKPARDRCSRCKDVFYCSEACQKLDWKRGHKKECYLRCRKCTGKLKKWNNRGCQTCNTYCSTVCASVAGHGKSCVDYFMVLRDKYQDDAETVCAMDEKINELIAPAPPAPEAPMPVPTSNVSHSADKKEVETVCLYEKCPLSRVRDNTTARPCEHYCTQWCMRCDDEQHSSQCLTNLGKQEQTLKRLVSEGAENCVAFLDDVRAKIAKIKGNIAPAPPVPEAPMPNVPLLPRGYIHADGDRQCPNCERRHKGNWNPRGCSVCNEYCSSECCLEDDNHTRSCLDYNMTRMVELESSLPVKNLTLAIGIVKALDQHQERISTIQSQIAQAPPAPEAPMPKAADDKKSADQKTVQCPSCCKFHEGKWNTRGCSICNAYCDASCVSVHIYQHTLECTDLLICERDAFAREAANDAIRGRYLYSSSAHWRDSMQTALDELERRSKAATAPPAPPAPMPKSTDEKDNVVCVNKKHFFRSWGSQMKMNSPCEHYCSLSCSIEDGSDHKNECLTYLKQREKELECVTEREKGTPMHKHYTKDLVAIQKKIAEIDETIASAPPAPEAPMPKPDSGDKKQEQGQIASPPDSPLSWTMTDRFETIEFPSQIFEGDRPVLSSSSEWTQRRGYGFVLSEEFRLSPEAEASQIRANEYLEAMAEKMMQSTTAPAPPAPEAPMPKAPDPSSAALPTNEQRQTLLSLGIPPSLVLTKPDE